MKNDELLSIFVGPTASRRARTAMSNSAKVRTYPPAKRLDIDNLVRSRDKPGTIVLIDGRYGDVAAVGHHEILFALDSGWEVIGISSIGAIRAAELERFGMTGFGQVFHHLKNPGVNDDEVAVLHGPGPDYRRMTEALVDLRRDVDTLSVSGILSKAQASEIVKTLAIMWFGYRTSQEFVEIVRQVTSDGAAIAAASQVSDCNRTSLKEEDLEAFLRQQGDM